MIAKHVVYLHYIHIADISRSKNLTRRLRTGHTGARGDLLPAPKGARHAHLSPKPHEQRNTY